MENKMLKPTELCHETIYICRNKTYLTILQQIILSIIAGACIALGGAASTVASHSIANIGLARFVSGAIFPVGLMLVMICGAELFTGNCLMIVSLMDRKINKLALLKNWLVVYIGNFIGSILIAFLVFQSGMLNLNSGKVGEVAIKIALFKINIPFWTAFSSAILCNILVCLAVWGATASKDVMGKITFAWFPIMAFATCGFEHCVANMYFLSIGVFTSSKLISISGIVDNLIPVTLGNIVGGSILVGMSYFIAYKKR